MDAFPDAKVVLSVRSPQTWYKSVHESIYKFHVLREDPAVKIFGYLIGKKKNMECVDDISMHPPKVGLTNDIHWSPLARSAFCPKKVDLTSRPTLHPGYNSI